MYWMYTGLSVPRNFSARWMSSSVADFPATSCAGFAGMTKKITYVTTVTHRNRKNAQRSLRTMNLNTGLYDAPKWRKVGVRPSA